MLYDSVHSFPLFLPPCCFCFFFSYRRVCLFFVHFLASGRFFEVTQRMWFQVTLAGKLGGTGIADPQPNSHF
jgi:hypothetical protein